MERIILLRIILRRISSILKLIVFIKLNTDYLFKLFKNKPNPLNVISRRINSFIFYTWFVNFI